LGEESTLSRILSFLPVVVIALIGLAIIVFYSTLTSPAPNLPPVATRSEIATPTTTGTPTPRRTASSGLTLVPHTPTPTVQPGGVAFELTPAANAVGWVSSDLPLVNHLGDYSILSGIYSTTIYYGVLQFDIGSIPQGTRLQYATLELVGQSSDKLVKGGSWRVVMLDPGLDTTWNLINFSTIRDAPVYTTIGAQLASDNLQPGSANLFDFTPEQLRALEQRLFAGRVSLRLDGPARGPDNLFTWDSGNKPNGLSYKPILRMGTGPLAPSPTPTFVLITPTPTARNEGTATAIAATATYVATAIGTATPLPPNFVTPVVVMPTVDTDVFAAATRSAALTAQAVRGGTSTPTPANWVVAILISATPTPGNAATAAAQIAAATAAAQTTGTPTPLPFNAVIVTATPTATPTVTPVFFPETLTPSPTPSVTPTAIPVELKGKIVFLSDRAGSGVTAAYEMDPDGRNVNRLSAAWAQSYASTLDKFGAGGTLRLAVTDRSSRFEPGTRIVIFKGTPEQPTTIYENETTNYDPAFSPDNYHIVFVSTMTGRDELYLTDLDATGVKQITSSTWEWNKHPSFSPDGKRITWWSNRETGRRQIWVMNTDGSGLINISNNAWNDYDPVWIK
jgi:WD40 repeat protein